jgi:CRP-like cAMP-binding protein
LTGNIVSSLAEAAEALAGNGLFRLFGQRLAEEIMARSRRRSLPPGGVLFRQGDAGDSAFVLLEGALEVLVDIGSEQVCLAVLHPYQLVGEIAVFANQPRIATVVAQGEARVLCLERQEMLQVVCANPTVAWAIIADLGQRLATVNTPLAFLSTATQLLHDDTVDGDALAHMAKSVGNLGPFADTFGTMVREIQAKQERQQDMAMARSIQDSVLPKGLRLEGDRLAIHAVIRPMKEVGGDLYDYFMVDDRHLAVIVADVSGKGVPAALFMVMLRTVMRAVAFPGMGPDQVLARANALLAEDNDACMFVTVFFGLLDIDSGRLAYVNAGHNPTYLLASEGPCRALSANGIALGIRDDARFEPRSVQMSAGDLLFLYTDGVTEAFSETHEQYGEARLVRLLEDSRRHSVTQLIDVVMADVDRFATGREQSDDITCLALVYGPPV